jgi:hypothetical protein
VWAFWVAVRRGTMSMNTLAVDATARVGGIRTPPSQKDSLEALTKYIPTESITLYVAIVSAQTALASIIPWLTPSVGYKVFVAVTPALMLILYLRHLAVAGRDWKVPPKSWPWWSMIASSIAFAVWAMAVPGNPIIDPNNTAGGVVAGVAALLVSTVLNIFAPFFENNTP